MLLEGVNDSAVEMMKTAGYSSIERLPKALDGDALREAVRGVHLLGTRSRTQINAEVLRAADRLIAIGCFNVGTNQVDIDAARRIGVPVFNAPFSNTRSVAELVIGEIVMLLRRIVPKSVAAHAGRWDKSATNSHEVRGKTLGIIGYGNIRSQDPFTTASLRLPDPNWFGGPVLVAEGRGDWRSVSMRGEPFAPANWPLTKPSIANHHDGGQSPSMMKGACGCFWGRVPVRETLSERSLLVGGHTPTANRTDLVSPYPKFWISSASNQMPQRWNESSIGTTFDPARAEEMETVSWPLRGFRS